MDFTSALSIKIRTAIKVKLAELGNDVYEELPDYIMVMIANRRNEEEMTEELSLFLGDNSQRFSSWLHNLLSKLQFVASVSPETKGNGASHSAQSEQNKTGVAPSYSDSASEHSDGEDASRAVPSSNEAFKTDQSPPDEDEQSNSPKSSGSVDHADSTSRGSGNDLNEPSAAGNSDCVKTEHSTSDNATNAEGVRKRKKHSGPRVFRVKSRKLDLENDNTYSGTMNTVSSSKLASELGTDASDSERETKSYTQIRKMKESNTSNEVSSSVVKSELLESVVELEGNERKSQENHDQEGDNDQTVEKEVKVESL